MLTSENESFAQLNCGSSLGPQDFASHGDESDG